MGIYGAIVLDVWRGRLPKSSGGIVRRVGIALLVVLNDYPSRSDTPVWCRWHWALLRRSGFESFWSYFILILLSTHTGFASVVVTNPGFDPIFYKYCYLVPNHSPTCRDVKLVLTNFSLIFSMRNLNRSLSLLFQSIPSRFFTLLFRFRIIPLSI